MLFRSKDTLIAQLLRSSTGRWLLDRHSENLTTNYTRVSSFLHDCRCAYFGRTKATVAIRDPQRVRQLILGSPSKIGKLISVEIECYNIDHDDGVGNGLTDIVSDGSLSNRSGVGRELRRISWVDSNGRLSGLLGLEKHFKRAFVDKTCGLHVHVDARHLPPPGTFGYDNVDPNLCDAAETYDRLTLMYPVLKKLVPKSRWNNNYCKFYNNREGSEDYRSPANGQRYAAINWCAYREHKTIEFRLGSGSTNLVKIESWALLCQFLLDWCSKRNNTVPTRWPAFLAILPSWLQDWCILRNLKLHGGLECINERVASAADFKITSGVAGTSV